MTSQKKDNQNVLVGVRIRPRNEKEMLANMPVYFNPSSDSQNVQELDENGVVIKHWGYDYVFGPESTNKEIFERMGLKLVDGAIEGYNTVMFMYGQTASGKTFTLFGDSSHPGVVDHAMEYLNHRVKTSVDTEFVIKLTYAELYNEELKDLLSPTPNENLKIIEDPNLGPMIQNITEASFASASEIRQHLDEGERRRHFGVTNMNAHSSRSHVIVRLCIESRKVMYRSGNPLRQSWGKDRPSCISTLNLVDLAGSERANKAGTTGQALKEGSFINRSLLTLGTVISNLSEGKLQHIPYRNSKLTRLLATALGGNAKTCVITCISPASGNLGESLNTLRFASRAKRVVNHVQKNEIMDMKTLTNKLGLQMMEIENLRAQLEMARQIGYVPDEEETNSGETIRDKAIMMSKYWRSIRFLFTNGVKIMNSLRSVGMSQLAKKFPSDLRAITISGNRDIQEIMEDYTTILQTYLSKERPLLGKIQDILMNNESETIINMNTMFETMLPDDENASSSSSPSPANTVLMTNTIANREQDIFHLLESGGEEMKEQIETLLFQKEDVLIRFHRKVEHHQQEHSDWTNKEKHYRKQTEELQHTIVEKNEALRQSKQNEVLLTKQIEDIHVKWRVDTNQQQELITELTKKIGLLEMKCNDQEKFVSTKQQELLYKENDVEKYKTQIEQLNTELQTTLQQKKNIEEESSRQRSEMRIQMERLRKNMHELLVQGGEEAKVIESHNSQLQREIDTLRDELTTEASIKQRIEMENSHLRAQMSISLEEMKGQYHTSTILKEENTDLLNKLRDYKLEITKHLSTISFLQQSNQQLEQQRLVDSIKSNEIIETKEKEYDSLQQKMKVKINEITVDLEIKDCEIESLKDQLLQKQNVIMKFEQSYQLDLSRIEKKLSMQLKINEEITAEKNHLQLQFLSLQQKHSEEIRQLKQKNQELQAMIDSINHYVEETEKELLVGNNSNIHYDDTISVGTGGGVGGGGEEITGSYLSHSLQKQALQKDKDKEKKGTLSRYASRMYFNENGKTINNFNSYYDMSSFYSSAPTTLNSEYDENWSDYESGGPSPNSPDRTRRGVPQTSQGEEPEDQIHQENGDNAEDDGISTFSSSSPATKRKGGGEDSNIVTAMNPSSSNSKLAKIKQFNEFYQVNNDKDEFSDLPFVDTLSISTDTMQGTPAARVGAVLTFHATSTPPLSALQKKASTPLLSPNGQLPFTPKVKFRSHSLSLNEGSLDHQITALPAVTLMHASSTSPDLAHTPTEQSPEGPIKRLLDDPRFLQQYQQYETTHQQLYESIYYGLSLSTLLLEVIYQEEKRSHQHQTQHHHHIIEQSLSSQAEIDTLVIEKESLYEKNQQLIQSITFLQEKNEFLIQSSKETEEKYYTLSREYSNMIHTDRLKQNQVHSLEENMLSEKVKVEKLSFEMNKYQQMIYELKRMNLSLESEKEVLAEKLVMMESQLEFVNQEKELLSLERDEVMRRFLPNLLKK